MIIDIFGSLKENFVKKVRNPFFGTFTIVFLLKNWQLFYSLFCFDSGDDRLTRIGLIEQYIDASGGTWCMFGYAVLCALMVMVISYILLNMGAYISNISDTIVNPWVVKFASRGAKIVTKEKYDTLSLRYSNLENRLEQERKRRHEAESELEKVEKEYADYRSLQNKEIDEEGVDNHKTILPLKAEKRADKIAQTIYDNEEWRTSFSRLLKIINENRGTKGMKDPVLDAFLLTQGVIGKKAGNVYFMEFGKDVRSRFLEKIV